MYVLKLKTLVYLAKYSRSDPGRRTAFASPLKKNKSLHCTHANVDTVRPILLKREPLISYALFASVQLLHKRPLSRNYDAVFLIRTCCV